MTYTIVLPLELLSPNVAANNRGRSPAARARYKKSRDLARSIVRVLRCAHRIPPATGKRIVTITRLLGPRQREFDYDNLVASTKVVTDALVAEGLLLDDDPEHCTCWYRQEGRDEGGVRYVISAVRVKIEDAARFHHLRAGEEPGTFVDAATGEVFHLEPKETK